MARNAIAFLCLLPALVALFVAFNNIQAAATLAVFGTATQLTSGAVLIIGIVLGAVAGCSYLPIMKSSVINTKKIEQWEVQDVKLAAAIKTDREKQLEAKIATLEVALKSALKK